MKINNEESRIFTTCIASNEAVNSDIDIMDMHVTGNGNHKHNEDSIREKGEHK